MSLILIGCHAAIRNQRPDLLITALLGINLVYLASAFLLLRRPASPTLVVAIAISLRLIAWTLPPALSDDLYRYRWEGKLQAAGGEVYQARPDDARWSGLRDETYAKVVGHDRKAGYGPVLSLLELAWFKVVSLATPNPVTQTFWFKLPFAIAELGILAASYRLLGKQRFPLYAFLPLPLVEVWWNGHNDAVPVLAVVVAVLLLRQEKPAWSAVSLGVGIAAKWWPAILIPAFLSATPRKNRLSFALLAMVPLAATSLHYLGNVDENLRFMTGFVGGWRNNDSLHGLLLAIAGTPSGAKKLAFALAGVAAVFFALRQWRLEAKILATLTALLLVSSNCHPWYLLWLAPFVPLFPLLPFLLAFAIMPFAYRVLIEWHILGVWNGSTPDRWLIWGPVFALAGAELLRTLKFADRWKRVTGMTRWIRYPKVSTDGPAR
ncbi:MAG TPA: glycosyltransferase 87 family protein [Bryobacteraceae bacterium]|nr:glycosyltransferase 87 family protein [Bryobacteraceae bacterium]